ncbi:MAG: hypothetical protein HOD63_05115 [Bacteroidetes bacterium]|nr:hypothetical protein [Bacteroidota bacterium]MBT5529881.1 hypothetical protein [Cytophagia bacterium]MBT3800548.1 hypothetical protein [Bacteroidota bacterium]MBT3935301.1 hypothetical protein [Bacteroidota bacterium]MBT4337946.1 hypothetical protein [Bacteroidota bacterium]
MKKGIFILLTLLFSGISSFTVNAQNNLQFNEAVFLEISGIGTTSVMGIYEIKSDTIIIDSGKVWKIESARANTLSILTINSAYITVNSKIITGNRGAELASVPVFPIWLTAGSYIIKLISTSSDESYGFISAIEFNIVQ